ncbi:MAG: peptidylprolyl isomerase [Bacteroidales bacterium]|nr:peptidylprolyl isomerase [Bacteroidales bacterium]
MYKLIFLFVFLAMCLNSRAQQAQAVFTIDGKKVYADEFKAGCQNVMTNADTAGIWDLFNDFIDFRLEAYDAQNRHLDSVSAYKNALNYYNNYLIIDHVVKSKEAVKFYQEALERSKYQYKLSYIRVNISDNSKADTLPAYKKISAARSRILNGQAFARAARQISDEPSANFNGGHFGWVAPIDFGVGYEAENYIINNYSSSEISMPIRSGDFYYIIKVEGRRQAVSDVTVSAILKSKNRFWQYNDSIRNLFNDIFKQLNNGANFSALQQKYSEYPFVSQTMPLKDAYKTFSTKLSTCEGTYKHSIVIETNYFFCILKVENTELQVFDDNYKQDVKNKFYGTDRFKYCFNNFMDSVKEASGYQKFSDLRPLYKLFPDSAIYRAEWQPGYLGHYTSKLFSLAGKEYTLSDFVNYVYNTQTPVPYNSIKNYLSEKYNDLVSSLLTEIIASSLNNDKVYKSQMEHFKQVELYNLNEKFQKFQKNASDVNKVYNFYKESSMTLKSNHVLYIRFYDYLTDKNRKKATKFVSALLEDKNYNFDTQILKTMKADTFYIGDYDLADKIIKGFDSGEYKISNNRVIDFPDKNIYAIVDVVKYPEEFSKEDIFPLVAPLYLKIMKQNYKSKLRTKYNLVILPEAETIIKNLF